MQDEGANNTVQGSKVIPLVLRSHRLPECAGLWGSPKEPVERNSLQHGLGQEPGLPSPQKTRGQKKRKELDPLACFGKPSQAETLTLH